VSDDVVQRFHRARRDPGLAVLEGFHALKHGLRFGAEILEVVACDPAELERLARDLAPDLAGRFGASVRTTNAQTFGELAPQAPRTGVMAIARRRAVDLARVLSDPAPTPVVLLENPRNLTNLGACVRVAAAADVCAVLTTGGNDPWHPDAVRGAAGLHYALPVASVPGPPETDRPLIAIDPGGDALRPAELPARAMLAFGTERDGLSDELLARADGRIGIPMRAGVSSLNLATSVAAVLYAWRLAAAEPASG